MFNRLDNFLLILNEMTLWLASIFSFLYTDFTYDPRIRYQFGEIWIGLVLFVLFIDIIALVSIVWLKIKFSLEFCIAKRAYEKKRAKLIASGKLVIKKELTDHEKRVLKYKAEQDKKKRKQKRDMRKALLARKAEDVKDNQSSYAENMGTPHYSDDLLSQRRHFEAIFEDDEAFREQEKKRKEWENRPKSREYLKNILDAKEL